MWAGGSEVPLWALGQRQGTPKMEGEGGKELRALWGLRGALTHSSTLTKPSGSWRRPQRIPARTRSCGTERSA